MKTLVIIRMLVAAKSRGVDSSASVKKKTVGSGFDVKRSGWSGKRNADEMRRTYRKLACLTHQSTRDPSRRRLVQV